MVEKRERDSVLLITGNQNTANVIKDTLAQHQIDVEIFTQAVSGIKSYKPLLHQVILVDYELPDLNGLQVLEAFKAFNNFPPVLFMVSRKHRKWAHEALKRGATDYVITDSDHFFVDLLPHTLHQLLEMKRLKHEQALQEEQLLHITGELEKSNRAYERLLYQDSLTGLANRTLFDSKMSEAILRANTNHKRFAMLYLDIDGLKEVSSHHGHITGDLMLAEISARLKHSLGNKDTIVRIGGDEYAIITEKLESEEDAASLARRIITNMSEPMVIEGEEITISASIGIAVYPEAGMSVPVLKRHADIALYAAKSESGNTFCFFTYAMQKHEEENQRLEHDLREALHINKLELFFQPQYNVADQSLAGAEALIRWRHPKLGMLSPGLFLPIAEKSQLTNQLSQWVLRHACNQYQHWQKGGLNLSHMCVNLSPRQVRQKYFAKRILDTLEQQQADPSRLSLEISERAFTDNIEQAAGEFKLLQQEKVRVSMDDFGTGPASLHHLELLPIDEVKIDKLYVDKISKGKADAALTGAIIDLAHQRGLKVVAEGVETEEQLAFLKDHDCDVMQGYLLGQPMNVSDFEHWTKKVAA